MLQSPSLALYVHIPWCVRKCPYCDFNSHRQTGELPEQAYLEALRSDLLESLPQVAGRRLCSIFIGGGTPSLLSPPAIARIVRMAEELVGFQDTIEITMEANPGTFEQDRFLAFRDAGINRLSIGIQSFSDLHLQQLGRIHGGAEALAAVAMARRAGFDNINLDLMHGLPGQTIHDARRDLQIAMNQGPEHLSWYQLTIEPNTEFYNHPPRLPGDELLADIQQCGEQLLAAAGYQHYEISAYSRPGRASVHNRNYWEFGDYLGIGAGAHAKLTCDGTISRSQKTRMPDHYLDCLRDFTVRRAALSAAELPLEFMMNALRLVQGVAAPLFAQRTGLSLDTVARPLQSLRERGLLDPDPERLQPSPTGILFLNEVLAEFVADSI